MKFGVLFSSLAIMSLTLPVSATNTIVQSNVCRDPTVPTITSPVDNDVIQDANVTIIGTADAGMTVTIIDNGQPKGSTTATSGDIFGLQVPLIDGQNQLMAQATNACGTTVDSLIVTITALIPVITPPPTLPPPLTPQLTPESLPGQPSPSRGVTEPLQPSAAVPSADTITLSQPRSGAILTTEQAWVRGTAPAGREIIIYVNDVIVARIFSGPDGTFAAKVPLKYGRNTIRAETGDGLAHSESIRVRYQGLVFPNLYIVGFNITPWLIALFIIVLLLLIWRKLNKDRRGKRQRKKNKKK